MATENEHGFATKAIHDGTTKEKGYRSLAMPIYQTSTFYFDTCEQGGRLFAGEEEGFIYSRLSNPTSTLAEEKIAELECGEAAIATSSGMGAITSLLWTVCKAGDHIVADEILYGCTYELLSTGMPKFGVDVTFVDTSDIEQVKNALQENTVAVYLETPANPTLKVADIAEVAKAAHEYNPDILVVCDNTFATPYLQKPLCLGADVVVHSATKYINGHGDVIAGFVVGKADLMAEVRVNGLKYMTGSVLGPQEAYYILRGLKTLEIRMQRHCENARAVAEFLSKNPNVEKVYFPGLESDPGYEVATKQMKDYGGMVSFEVKGGKQGGIDFCNSLKLITIAVSLGDPDSLVEHPASMTHSTYTPEELAASGISEGLIRMSVGLEDIDDLLEDLGQALDKI